MFLCLYNHNILLLKKVFSNYNDMIAFSVNLSKNYNNVKFLNNEWYCIDDYNCIRCELKIE